MAKTALITGGAASGKSRWAATYFSGCDYVLYLRTGKEVDKDTQKRIDYDNKEHLVEWDIVTDVYSEPVKLFTDHKFVIFDDLTDYTNAVINEMCPDIEKITYELTKEIERKIIGDITAMYDSIKEIDGSMVIITMEPGFSVTPENIAHRTFRDILGGINQRIANISDEVYLSASGIQFRIK
ncbi:MAG: bifunctional adenosylcobinamide kinase/adenosylcobinamide-phosphate guanylyltransferase [Oscillospiraceae bacterium]|nr:bifunctional adenosylcobinamide kinase/adenosylcobinamide-phosphate guanylyltransferase [Oscillospiraceae bacterium]